MALLFMDGFDTGIKSEKWTYIDLPGTSSSTRFSTGLCARAYNANIARKRVAAASKLILGFAYHPNGVSHNSGRYLLTLAGDTGVTTHLTLRMPNTNQIELRRGDYSGSVLATGAMSATGWHYVEVSATLSDTVGTAVVRVDGAVVIDYTGDTKNAGTNTTLDTVTIGGASTTDQYIDDLYICDDTGSTNNTFLGDVRVQTLMPNGAGSSTQFTPTGGANYANVAEVTDSLATYNASSTVGHRDTYAMGDLAAGTGPIYGVQSGMTAWKTDAGTGAIKSALKAGSTVYYDSTIALGTSATGYYNPIRETNPATTTAWTVSDINGVELGAEVA